MKLFVDTEDLYTIAFQNIVSQYGKDYTFDMKMKLMGTQAHESASILVSELNLPLTPDQFMEACKEQYLTLFPDTSVLPGKLSVPTYLIFLS